MRKLLFLFLAIAFLLGLSACGVSQYELSEAIDEAYARGFEEGYEEGYGTANAEWDNRLSDIREEGYNEGFTSGQFSGYAEGYKVGEADGYDECEALIRNYAEVLFMTQEEMQEEYDKGFLTTEDIIGLYGRAREKLTGYGAEG